MTTISLQELFKKRAAPPPVARMIMVERPEYRPLPLYVRAIQMVLGIAVISTISALCLGFLTHDQQLQRWPQIAIQMAAYKWQLVRWYFSF